ncbi:MAG: hypothetical protein ACP5RD_08830, partial [bacterium]
GIIDKYIANYKKGYDTDKMITDLIEKGDIKLKEQLFKNLDNNKTLLAVLKNYKESLKYLKGVYPERMEMPEHFVSQYIDFLEKETEKITDGLDKAINTKFNKYLADKPQSKDSDSVGSANMSIVDTALDITKSTATPTSKEIDILNKSNDPFYKDLNNVSDKIKEANKLSSDAIDAYNEFLKNPT